MSIDSYAYFKGISDNVSLAFRDGQMYLILSGVSQQYFAALSSCPQSDIVESFTRMDDGQRVHDVVMSYDDNMKWFTYADMLHGLLLEKWYNQVSVVVDSLFNLTSSALTFWFQCLMDRGFGVGLIRVSGDLAKWQVVTLVPFQKFSLVDYYSQFLNENTFTACVYASLLADPAMRCLFDEDSVILDPYLKWRRKRFIATLSRLRSQWQYYALEFIRFRLAVSPTKGDFWTSVNAIEAAWKSQLRACQIAVYEAELSVHCVDKLLVPSEEKAHLPWTWNRICMGLIRAARKWLETRHCTDVEYEWIEQTDKAGAVHVSYDCPPFTRPTEEEDSEDVHRAEGNGQTQCGRNWMVISGEDLGFCCSLSLKVSNREPAAVVLCNVPSFENATDNDTKSFLINSWGQGAWIDLLHELQATREHYQICDSAQLMWSDKNLGVASDE
eukprot:ANDGO_07322.mRNA.1 hypothetical protein